MELIGLAYCLFYVEALEMPSLCLLPLTASTTSTLLFLLRVWVDEIGGIF